MSTEEISAELIQSCIRQERRAQNTLYRLTYARLMNICNRYARGNEEARELFIQGFMKILSKLESYRPHIPFESWISRVMINTIIDEYRKNLHFKERHFFTENGVLEYHSPADYNEFERQMSNEQAISMLKQLPPSTREVFMLFAIDNYTHKEIGQMLGISENTSKWHVADARKKLMESLGTKFKREKVSK